MDEYIEREAAIAYAPLSKHLREYQTMNLDDAWEDGYDFAIRQIESIPSADVQPVVHGKWEDGDVDGIGACGIEYRYKKCSICDYEYSFPIKYNFCPNCGADMREANDGI